ncbi:MAG: M48 family metallopeptidase [Clostridiales bacterium]|jgi:predicted metal-dependent hydrolase|nr:M48 family metallopeptidase [Clostridiales bacterium]
MRGYELQRSKRKTVSVIIRDGALTVRAPLKTPRAAIDKFVESKEAWIADKLARHAETALALKDVADCKAVLLYGGTYPIAFSDAVKKIELRPESLAVPFKLAANGKNSDNAALKRALGRWLKNTAAAELSRRLDDVSVRCAIPYAGFKLTNAKTKWGSCDNKGVIRLNWRLIMTEPFLTDYVIIHELCHTLYHNHSSKFWAEVAKLIPNYKSVRSLLKRRSAITMLYR